MTGPIATEVVLDLGISADEYLRFYEGRVSAVQARARDGRTVRFPASMLRSFVDTDGVHGSFLLRYDQHNRLISLERLPGDR